MSWSHWPLTKTSDAQSVLPWQELVAGINERAVVAGKAAVDLSIVPGLVMFQRSAFRALMDKLNELLPCYLEDAALLSGDLAVLDVRNPVRAFTLQMDWVVQTLASVNELYSAVNLMNRTVVGNGVLDGTATSVNGDLAQHFGGNLWNSRYIDAATARSTLWANWNQYRTIYAERNLSWALSMVICAAKEEGGGWYGLFDADWANITSESDVELHGYAANDVTAELYAKLSPSFWTILPWSSDWKTIGEKFTDYPFSHPGGLKHGLWGRFGTASSWSGNKPVSTDGNNQYLTEPVEQNWCLNAVGFYTDNGRAAQYDAKWVVKWPFEKGA